MKLYSMPKSGNCYKVAWMLSLVQKPFEMVPVNTLKGEQRLPTFLEKNPLGKIPVLELDNGQCLSESNAILLHLAETSNRQPSLIPSDPYRRGLVYQWLFFEQHSHAPFLSPRRAAKVFNRPTSDERMQELLEGGNKALQVMETNLKSNDYTVGNEFSVADVSLFAYTHLAHEGEFDLEPYPSVQAWLDRVRNTEGFVTMDAIMNA